jgi:hypothetical protein
LLLDATTPMRCGGHLHRSMGRLGPDVARIGGGNGQKSNDKKALRLMTTGSSGLT